MRKIGIILLVCMLLCGCAATPTFETLGDIPHEQGEAGAPLRIQLQLPPDALRYEDSYFFKPNCFVDVWFFQRGSYPYDRICRRSAAI